ncbi:MAG: hypothetical protein JNK02_13600 [Planctomycetes bacterium]|nr:hypothetical protein [Planctomycetota bacterium]
MLRVGSVPYLVGRPLDEGLGAEPGIRLERRVPAELVAGLRAGELDVALVSAIELFRAPGYRWIDGLAVAGEGHVGSVQVFLRRPVAELGSVALDPASRAAATLVRVLFERRIGGDRGLPRAAVRWVEVAPGADPREAGTDAWLRIGDPALREHLAPGSPPAFNPCAEWSARTGLPFVFAVWIVAPGVELGPEHLAAFARARRRGRECLDSLAREAAAAWSLPAAACGRYLREECLYEPGPRMGASLRRLRDEAAALGLARAELDPAPLELAHVA